MDTRFKLMDAGEHLIARHGLRGVSMRQIAREAGQRNHSALQYHFGDLTALTDAITRHRLRALNRQRARLLDAAPARADTETLVTIIAAPFFDHLARTPDCHTLRFLVRVFPDGQLPVPPAPAPGSPWTDPLQITVTHLRDALPPIAPKERERRLRLLFTTLLYTLARLEAACCPDHEDTTLIAPDLDAEQDSLCRFLSAGLDAPPPAPNAAPKATVESLA